VCNVPLILILHCLFKVVNKNVALMMFMFSFLANALESVSLLADFTPLVIFLEGHDLSTLTAEQLNALAYLSGSVALT
jgi:hypothetical protein